jgi:protein-S-isoprenylcysteine O-methyltransferase Ste14
MVDRIREEAIRIPMTRIQLYAIAFLVRLLSDVPYVFLLYFLQFPKQGSGGWFDASFNAVLFGTFAVIHSLFARDFAQRGLARVTGEDFAKPTYVVANGIVLLLVLYFWRPISGTLWQTEGPAYWVLTGLCLASVAGLFYTCLSIDYQGFLGIRVFLRKLAGKPSRPIPFSAAGPYAHVRHPMYLFFIGVLWIGPVMTYGRVEFAFLGTAYMIVGVFLEERNLRKEFGEVYDDYRANVPMWIPRLRAWKRDVSAV